MKATVKSLELDRKEVRILVQSLQNCIATCKTHAKKPDAPCADCDGAKALQKKLKGHLKAKA
jgi:hypothetical protein